MFGSKYCVIYASSALRPLPKSYPLASQGFTEPGDFRCFWQSLGRNQQPQEEVLPWPLLLGAPCCLISRGTLRWKYTGIASCQQLKSCLPLAKPHLRV